MIYLKDMSAFKEKRGAKYHNVKVTVDGIRFDSAKEAWRWSELQLLERAGEISGLERQVPFELIPEQTRSDGKKEKPIIYVADFTYWQDGRFVVEDVKGLKTREYVMKRKLMLAVHEIEIQER